MRHSYMVHYLTRFLNSPQPSSTSLYYVHVRDSVPETSKKFSLKFTVYEEIMRTVRRILISNFYPQFFCGSFLSIAVCSLICYTIVIYLNFISTSTALLKRSSFSNIICIELAKRVIEFRKTHTHHTHTRVCAYGTTIRIIL